MSLMGTLARIGVAIIAAKGAGKVLDQFRGGGSEQPKEPGQGRGGLEDLLGSVLGGEGRSGGGLGDILSDLGGGKRPGGGTGGLEDILRDLGGRRGGGSGSGGNPLEDILGGILGGASGGRQVTEPQQGGTAHPPGSDRISDIFNQAFRRRGEPDVQPTREQDAAAGLMLRAMIQAARADGRIDEGEREKLFEELGDASAEERAFVERELSARVDPQALARQVPEGLEQPVYTMSVLAIDLDNRNEGQYLHDLATSMGLGRDAVNAIHARIGAPPLYR